MYVTWEKLLKSMQDGDHSYKNFVKTFGFVVVKDFFGKEEYKTWIKEYDKCYENHFKRPFKKVMKNGGQAMVPNFVDDSEFFSKAAFDDRFIGMAKYFCGDDFLYMGSDGSAFETTSFKWHRDWFTHTPVIKFNMYLNPRKFFGGNFLIIPGSQIPSDSYANLLNRALAWPFGETKDGGLNERNFLPKTPSPRQPVLRSMWHRLFPRRKFQLPYTVIKVRKGDIVIFDQRAIHVVERTIPQVTRRLLTLLFAENPKSLPDKHYTLNPPKPMTRDKMSKEIDSLFWLERELIKIPPYGKYIDENHLLRPKHLFTDKISSSEEASPIDLSQYSSYADKATDPGMKNVWYTSNMLGFNVDHIRDIEG